MYTNLNDYNEYRIFNRKDLSVDDNTNMIWNSCEPISDKMEIEDQSRSLSDDNSSEQDNLAKRCKILLW